MFTFDLKFDFLDPNRMVLGITYARAFMVNPEEPDYEDEEAQTAYILTFGFFFFSFNVLIMKV